MDIYSERGLLFKTSVLGVGTLSGLCLFSIANRLAPLVSSRILATPTQVHLTRAICALTGGVAGLTLFCALRKCLLQPLMLKEKAVRRESQLRTEMQEAIRAGNINGVTACLEKGCDLNSTIPYQKPFLQIAIDASQPEILELLIEKRADPNIEIRGSSPLIEACQDLNSGEKSAQILINAGADIRVVIPPIGDLLCLVICNGWKDIASLLIEKGITINDDHLRRAIETKNENIIELLVNKNATCENPELLKPELLKNAISYDLPKIVSILIKNGADPEAATSAGATPLIYAAQTSLAVTVVLVEAGVGVNKAANNGQTPLHRAVQKGKTDIVAYLIDRGADTNAVDSQGKHPVDRAQSDEMRALFPPASGESEAS